MLKALARWILREEAPQTEAGHNRNCVSQEQLELALEKFEQRTEWELNEWYDKFSTLHARAEKRVTRDARKNGAAQPGSQRAPQPEDDPRPSVLALRKPWSV